MIDIWKTFTPFLIALALKGLYAFYLSFSFIVLFFFWKTSKKKEEGDRMQHFVSVFEKERLKGMFPFLWCYNNFFFGLLYFRLLFIYSDI